jgi:hypothetical protein
MAFVPLSIHLFIFSCMEVLVLKPFSIFRLKEEEKNAKEHSEKMYLCIYNLNLYKNFQFS